MAGNPQVIAAARRRALEESHARQAAAARQIPLPQQTWPAGTPMGGEGEMMPPGPNYWDNVQSVGAGAVGGAGVAALLQDIAEHGGSGRSPGAGGIGAIAALNGGFAALDGHHDLGRLTALRDHLNRAGRHEEADALDAQIYAAHAQRAGGAAIGTAGAALAVPGMGGAMKGAAKLASRALPPVAYGMAAYDSVRPRDEWAGENWWQRLASALREGKGQKQASDHWSRAADINKLRK